MKQENTNNLTIPQICLDPGRRGERLALMGLGEAEYRLALLLHDAVIRPHHVDIIDNFYRLMAQNREFIEIIQRSSSIDRQKKLMRDYLGSLGLNYTTAEYFNSRLRIGLAHSHAGVSLSLYISAYRILHQLILDAIPADSSKREVLMAFVLKIIHLDMSLAIDAYHLDEVGRLQSNLQRVSHSYDVLKQRQDRDSLTGVYSRDALLEFLAQDMERFTQAGGKFCLVMVDIDHFKHVNDSFGHLIGDAVLHDLASRMQSQLRSGDIVGRYGGEEFILLFHDIELDNAREICERIRRFIAASPVSTHQISVDVTVSMGLTEPVPGDSTESLIARADKALYVAKNSGRNRLEEASG